VKWKSLSDSENTWEDENELVLRDGGPLLVAYHREKSLKFVDLTRVTRQMPFEIVFGYRFNGAIHYRIRFENGVTADLTSDEVQEANLKKLVDFLEGLVPKTPEKKG
jgi:hypothetical protein